MIYNVSCINCIVFAMKICCIFGSISLNSPLWYKGYIQRLLYNVCYFYNQIKSPLMPCRVVYYLPWTCTTIGTSLYAPGWVLFCTISPVFSLFFRVRMMFFLSLSLPFGGWIHLSLFSASCAVLSQAVCMLRAPRSFCQHWRQRHLWARRRVHRADGPDAREKARAG